MAKNEGRIRAGFLATGRTPATAGLGLERSCIAVDHRGAIVVDVHNDKILGAELLCVDSQDLINGLLG